MSIAQLGAAIVGVALLTLAPALGAGNAHGKDFVPSAPPLKGQVVDVETGQPIANALVMTVAAGDYSSLSMHGGNRVLWRYATLAGADGRFNSPAWTWSTGRE